MLKDLDMRARLELFAHDLDELVAFYSHVLRFNLSDDRRGSDSPYVGLSRGSVRIGAVPAWRECDTEARVPPTGVEIVLEVADLDAEERYVRALGWPLLEGIVRRSWGLRDFRLRDPDGYFVRVTHEPMET